MSASASGDNPLFDYWRDAYERSVLFLDVLRQRGNQYETQAERVAPNVLTFEPELIVDGRHLPTPVNYVLVRIVPPADVRIDPLKRPFIVFDPRAGHGPGIGGMKHDSEIGVAMRAGHPCYFVGFLPQPIPGQTIENVCRAELEFVRVVSDRHRDADGKPVLIGNCQAGWQIMIAAAMEPDVPGPIILAGTPLSYWAGVRGKNPMRYLGGMLGGTWLTALAGDLGHGTFDGASLVANFETNNPANTFWTKNYNVYAHVDTEASRFLEFEKWWGTPVTLNATEMQFITDKLFVGNELAAGKIRMSDNQRIDLRRIKSPIVVFCSFGDDITPPQQALDWILDVYRNVDDIVAANQTIIYSLHQSIGHLGIFVSGSVATKEHEEFAFNIDLIDVMPPGLYEIVLSGVDESTLHPDMVSGNYLARLKPRTLDDIRALGHNDEADERRFQTMARVSDINRGLYQTFVSPAVQAMASPMTAQMMREAHPHRVRFKAFSDRNPMMAPVAGLADKIRADRHPVDDSNPMLAAERMASSWIETNLQIFAKMREAATEALFLGTYGSPWLQALVGVDTPAEDRTIETDLSIAETQSRLENRIASGGFPEAGIRALIFVLRGQGADERQFNALEALRNSAPDDERVPLSRLKDIMREQAAILRLDEARAMTAIPSMLSDDIDRKRKVFAAIESVVSTGDRVLPEIEERLHDVRRLFGLDDPTILGAQDVTAVDARRRSA
jgi:hypothetical protein